MKIFGRIFLLCISAGWFVSCAHSPSTPTPPEKFPVNYSLTKGEPVPIPAQSWPMPVVVYGQDTPKKAPYVASGYMGDTESISLVNFDDVSPFKTDHKGHSLKVRFVPRGRAGWVGVYWLTPANNWGKIKGAGYDLTAAKQLTFWARGEKGGERLAEIKIGGIVGPYPDTDTASRGALMLTPEWKLYTIDLTGKDLRHIVGGFAFIVRRADNPQGCVFYLDQIQFENPELKISTTPAVVSAATTTVAATPTINHLQDAAQRIVPYGSNDVTHREMFNRILDEIVESAKYYPLTKISIEGHTDNTGPADMNMRLSVERAKGVAEYLTAHGIDAKRISVKGHGEERPLTPDSNKTPEGRKKNRRVEVILFEQ
jgi:outer membrane protein OmpA-like peptidoglycan-associated protein